VWSLCEQSDSSNLYKLDETWLFTTTAGASSAYAEQVLIVRA